MAMLAGIGAGMAALGAYGAYTSGALNKQGDVDQYQNDPNAYVYGGQQGYLNRFRGGLEGDANSIGGRQGPDMNWSAYDQDAYNAGQARLQQQGLAQSYQDVLSGKAPSLAEQQMRMGQAQAAAQGYQMAASARGGVGAQLLAQRDAQRQAALGELGVQRDAAMLRAKEQEQARQGLGGLLGQMRGQDYQGQGQDLSRQLGTADVGLRQTGLNDARYGTDVNAQLGVNRDAMAGHMAGDQARQNAYQWAQGMNVGIDAANKQRSAQFWGSLAGGGASMMGMGVGAMGKGGGGSSDGSSG